MPYTPENNPYIPGDPYSYDLKWIVSKLKAHDGSIESIQEDISDIKQFIEDIQAAQISGDPWNLKNKKMLFFGDSITYGYNGDGNNGRVALTYPKIISLITGALCFNNGISGATMARKAVNVNDLLSQLQNKSDQIPNADYICLAFGINDYIQNVPIGPTDSDSWNTFNGAMQNAVEYIRTFNDKCEIIFISPWPNQYYFNTVNNGYGANIRAYINAVREFCAAGSYKYIEPSRHMGLSKDNWQALTVDNTHYSQPGYTKAALCILYNFGGDDTDPDYDYEDNIFEPLSIPCYNEIGEYQAVLNGVTSTQNSYNDFDFEEGLYRIEYEALLDGSSYTVEDGYVGAHLYIGSTSLTSLIGFKPDAQWHHYVSYKKLAAPLSGKMAFRPANSAGATITDLFIRNVKIYPLSGQKVVHDDLVILEPIGGAGSVKVLRKNGMINVYVDITPTDNIAANAALTAQSNAYQKISNQGVAHYWPIMISATAISRAGISAANTLNVSASLTASNRILGAITY